MVIFAPHLKPPARPLLAAGVVKPLTVEGFKKITEATQIRAATARVTILISGIPTRRRMEILSGLPLRTQLIVSGAFFRVFQNFVGLTDFLEFCFGVSLFTDIRMVFAGQLAV
jgi:hypothetical protein